MIMLSHRPALARSDIPPKATVATLSADRPSAESHVAGLLPLSFQIHLEAQLRNARCKLFGILGLQQPEFGCGRSWCATSIARSDM